MAMQMKCVPQLDTGQYGKNIGLNERDTDFQSIIAIVNAKGNHPINNPPLIARPNKTPRITWPAVIFANSRTASEMGRAN